MIKTKSYCLLILAVLLIPVASSYSFINDGRFASGRIININDGGTVKGVGSFDAPNIVIRAKKFAFTGTINCGKLCFIQSEEPFDPTMFTANGAGEYIIMTKNFSRPILVKCSQSKSFEEVKPGISLDKRRDWFDFWISHNIKDLKYIVEGNSVQRSSHFIEFIVRSAKSLHLDIATDISVQERKDLFNLCISPVLEELGDNVGNDLARRSSHIIEFIVRSAKSLHLDIATDISVQERKDLFNLCISPALEKLGDNIESYSAEKIGSVIESMIECARLISLSEDCALQQLNLVIEQKMVYHESIKDQLRSNKYKAIMLGVASTIIGLTAGYFTYKSLKDKPLGHLQNEKLNFEQAGVIGSLIATLIGMKNIHIGFSTEAGQRAEQSYEKYRSIRAKYTFKADT